MADKLDGAAIVANSLPATAIVAGSITTTQLAPSVANVVTVGSNPKIASLDYPGDDTAANTGGGQTVVINGSGFKSNVSVYINGNAVPSVTYTNANSISITTPALAAATYPLYVINTDDGGTAILIPGIQYSGTPSWVTTSPLSEQQALSSWSISLSATSDSSVTYALQAGSSLPTGISLAANGLISGTMSSPPENDTTYNFTVVATDAELQDASKAFSVSVTVIVDTQFQYTTLLLQADGTNNGNNHAFLDSSNNNFTITRNGNVTQGSFTPFSPTGWSYYFSSSAVTLGTTLFNGLNSSASFTMEAWVYPLSYNSPSQVYYSASIFSKGQVYLNFGLNGSGQVHLYHYDGSARNNNSNTTAPLNQWTHIAAVVTGGTITFYVNGIASGTATWYGHIGDNQISRLGSTQDSNASGSSDWLGYISNARFSTGPIYTAAFTPANSPLSVSANTRFLTGQSNRFVDSNTTPTTLTVAAGTPSVQTFSPFPTTTAYSPATHGGAAFFDGSGDYLTVANNPAFAFGTGEFTIEGWVYILAGGDKGIFQQGTSHFPTSTSNSLALGLVNSGSVWQIYAKNTNTNSTATYTLNTWTHFALIRSGTTTTLYINGASAITLTSDTTNYTGEYFGLGAIYGTSTTAINAYITNVRVVKGTAVYTSGFTPPTSPPSNIANTSLLCNFTNAQIYDADASSVLETRGAAKVSTAINKFGSGSINLYSNGGSDYLTLRSPNGSDLGAGDFTVEFWMYPQSLTTSYSADSYATIMDADSASGYASTAWWVIHQLGQTIYFGTNDGSGAIAQTGSVINAANTWHHVAVSRAGGIIRTFVNGTQANTITYSSQIGSQTRVLNIGYQSFSGRYWKGYLDDVRISRGLARYRYNFTPPTRAFPTKGGSQTLTADEYFDYTTLLLPGNGTNNQNNHTFLDSSNNNFTITRNGNATQGTFSPFSQTGWSNYFDATGKYLSVAYSSPAFNLTGDFTVECWIYPTNLPSSTGTAAQSYARIWSFGTYNASNSLGLEIGSNDSGFLRRLVSWYNGTQYSLSGNNALAPNQWYHIAVVRSGTTITCYVNGVATGTITGASAAVNRSQPFYIASLQGYESDSSAAFAGHISNLRVLNGTAAYTSNFTPSTTALTAVANTTLLTCQSNRFIDVSNAAATITAANTPSVQAFSPFNPTASYAAANVGGSGYFDGSGDYLTVPAGSAFAPGTGDFTIEAWVYPTTSSIDQYIWTQTVSGTNYFLFAISSTATLIMTASGGGTPGISGPANSIRPYAWNHVAAVRSSGTVTVYVNGVAGTPGTNALDLTNTSYVPTIGTYTHSTSSSPLNGYLASLRYVKGTAVYATAFTPPTAPLTNIANTSFLCNFTNAGITDATAKTVFETIGDAKISTAQSKFGGSSIAFDGTGDRLYRDVRNERYFNLGNGGSDFTFECWVYFNSLSGCVGARGGGFAGWNSSTGHQINLGSFSGGSFYIQWWNGSTIVSNQLTIPFATGRWYHYAITLSSGTLRWFVDGIQRFTSSATIVTPSQAYYFTLGDLPSVDGAMNGYMDDVRITEGIARYTQNFALPTTAFLTK